MYIEECANDTVDISQYSQLHEEDDVCVGGEDVVQSDGAVAAGEQGADCHLVFDVAIRVAA